jgi:hypothetical protein
MPLELEIRREGSLGSVTRLTITEAQANSILAVARTNDLTYGEVLKFLADRRAEIERRKWPTSDDYDAPFGAGEDVEASRG